MRRYETYAATSYRINSGFRFYPIIRVSKTARRDFQIIPELLGEEE